MAKKKTDEVPEEVIDTIEVNDLEDNAVIDDVSEPETKAPKQKTRFNFRNLVSTKKRKVLVITGVVLLLLTILFAVPITRYAILSPIVKKDVSLTITDSKTNKPVSNVSVELGGVSGQTDKDGVARLKSVPVGQYELKVTKQYYQAYTTEYTVPVLASPQSPTLDINAVGRQVAVSVANKITGDVLSDAVIEASGTKATTDSDGTATIILPPTNDLVKATIKKDGFNTVEVELKVDEAIVNEHSLTPEGSIYYLSKATGKINVMKSNLDGMNATIEVAATGQESDYETSLLSSRDWQYSALSATRSDNKQRLYLIDANKNDFTVMDEGNATFSIVGWSGHNFIYIVNRNSNLWENKRYVLKSFNADTRKITVLDETAGVGSDGYNYAYEYLSNVYIMKDELVYVKYWSFSYYGAFNDGNRVPVLYSVNPAGGSKKVIKTFASNKQVTIKLYEPQGLYVQVNNDNAPSTFYEYENGTIKEVNDTSDNQFNSFYPTFIISPSGNKTLWYEPRDGKNTVFIGNALGEDAKTIGNLSEYTPYGWYGKNDEYILLTKSGSELYISSSTKVIGEKDYQPLKVTDYHKTRVYAGYGYGYGGQ